VVQSLGSEHIAAADARYFRGGRYRPIRQNHDVGLDCIERFRGEPCPQFDFNAKVANLPFQILGNSGISSTSVPLIMAARESSPPAWALFRKESRHVLAAPGFSRLPSPQDHRRRRPLASFLCRGDFIFPFQPRAALMRQVISSPFRQSSEQVRRRCRGHIFISTFLQFLG